MSALDDLIENDLRERVRSLECLYAVSSQLEKAEDFKDSLHAIAGIVKSGFQFPQKASVSISIDNNFFGDNPPSFRNGLSGYIILGGIKRGEIRVTYNGKIAFTDDEKKLLREISERLSRELERQELKRELASNLTLLESIIQEKNCEVEECVKLNKALALLTQELGEKRKQLETFFSSITDTIFVIDSEYRIVMSNRSISPGGQFCHKKFFNRMTVCGKCPARSVFETGERNTSEYSSGSSRYLVQVYPITGDTGRTEQVIIKYNDVTKVKQLEEHLIQSNKLASLGKLVAGIAHEINNPNTFLHGNLVILREAFADMLPMLDGEYQRNPGLAIARLPYDVFRSNMSLLLDDMVQGTDRIKTIVDALKHFARKNEDSMMSEEIDINEIVAGSLHLVENELKRRVEVISVFPENLPPAVGNSQKLEQVVINLLINASQAITDRGGLIRVETGYGRKENELFIRITDNGCGMDDATLKNMFDPFFTTKRESGGTGLGLSLSYGIVKEHRGRIVCTSEKGKGTVFTVFLPAAGTGKK